MQRVGLYVRVSTQEQVDKGWSIEAQCTELRRFCDSREEWKVVRAFKSPSLTIILVAAFYPEVFLFYSACLSAL